MTKLVVKPNIKLFFTDGEAGNYLSTPVYTTGTAASACPAPTVPKDGLCA